ncbi:nucleotidyltransferase domain-containing protein [Magnetovirga frankeli]|uniref:type VII toxin-antitoxin system MntA family adenylyltransferase antitoxin n=1 Tax=Magnetovirga frankeli TaxID=947516 RepID=UPI001293F90A|nr:nucleotidyltransferase domain-containing protein [gamma proteobacterium SS-5]
MTKLQTPTTPQPNEEPQASDASLRKVLEKFPEITLAMLFGSVAQGTATASSDLDIAVAARHHLSAEQKMALITALADHTGRPIDLIDLNSIGQPLLSQIVMHGRRVLGSAAAHGELISRHLVEMADFMPLLNRILKERREAWIGK